MKTIISKNRNTFLQIQNGLIGGKKNTRLIFNKFKYGIKH